MLQKMYHEPYGIYTYPVSNRELVVRLKTVKGYFQHCNIYYIDRYVYDSHMNFETMDKVLYDDRYDYYSIIIKEDSKRFKYFFELIGKDGVPIYYYEKGISREMPENKIPCTFFQYPYINEGQILDIPKWAKEAVFYQIFVDRFFNGDKNNDPSDISSWGTKPKRDSFFGGDIVGITQKLEYLHTLGVDAIYLTPIFLSDSNHKYETIDYYTIDPHFGTLEEMQELVKKAHSLGIKIVLDAVFNQCSYKNPIFQDVIKNGKNSPYADWFYIHEFPIKLGPHPNYETFGLNIYEMPRFNTSNPEVVEYLINVAEYWTKELDIDGWRLDVADEVDHNFWREFRKRMRSIKEDLFIIGEVWYTATPWLMGDQFDSVMNYPFRQALIDFFIGCEIDAYGLNNRLVRNLSLYKEPTNYVLLNLLGSHDTSRFITLCDGDVKKMSLSIVLMMTFIGIPMIYYGDEVGIDGGEDPDCRRTMIWDESDIDKNIFELYKNLINIRKNNIALVYGSYKFLTLTDNTWIFSFLRCWHNENILVIINNSNEEDVITIDRRDVPMVQGKMVDLIRDEIYDFDEGNVKNLYINSYDFKIIKLF